MRGESEKRCACLILKIWRRTAIDLKMGVKHERERKIRRDGEKEEREEDRERWRETKRETKREEEIQIEIKTHGWGNRTT